MGRIYRPVRISYGPNSFNTVAILDTGADETVISERVANLINADFYGEFYAVCASDSVLKGKQADVQIEDLASGKSLEMMVGVSDIPFSTDDIDDEGVDIILGINFIQKTRLEIKI